MGRKKSDWTPPPLVEEYEHHLNQVCGASRSTRYTYIRLLRDFFEFQCISATSGIRILEPFHLVSFIRQKAKRYKPKTVKLICSALRSWLQFLHFKGLCEERLIHAIPSMLNWKLQDIPQGLSDNHLSAILSCIDKSTGYGLRDYAVILCMVRLGLRSQEVASLTFNDIDWRKGVLRIPTTKSRCAALMPLPNDVGEAIAAYLEKERPSSEVKQVFVCHRKAIGSPITRSAIAGAVKRAFRSAGITSGPQGTHIFRRTLAIQMIRSGARLKEIADVLRHKNLNTTTIYAKVDLAALRRVVLPWKGVQ